MPPNSPEAPLDDTDAGQFDSLKTALKHVERKGHMVPGIRASVWWSPQLRTRRLRQACR